MKQLFLLLISIVLIAIISRGQSTFYDAQKIANLHPSMLNNKISIPNNDIAFRLLRNYTLDKDSTKNLIGEAFKGNPFISVSIPEGGLGVKKSNILTSIGNLDVTNIADGLAQFLIKRGKEELNIAFFQQMKIFLDSNIEAKTLFTATSKFLGNIESYRYSEFLQSLREAFYKDISNLIVNLNQLIDLPKYENLLKALPEIRVAIRSAKIISELSQADSSMHPANLISHFASLKEWGEMNINLQSSWQVLNKISESVRKTDYTVNVKYDSSILKKYVRDSTINPGGSVFDTIKLTGSFYQLKPMSAGRDTIVKLTVKDSLVLTPKYDTVKNDVAWIKFSDFNNNILSDSIALKIYLGLLYQKMAGIAFRDSKGNVTNVQKFMYDNQYNIFKIADLIENFLVLANDVEQSIKDIRDKKDKGLTDDDFYTYIEKSINVIDYGFKVANTIKDGIADDRYIVMARNANNLYKNIYTKNYNAAVMNGYLILKQVLNKPEDALAEKSVVVIDSSSVFSISAPVKSNFIAAKNSVSASKFFAKDSIDNRLKLVENILKYGNVMASIINAQSPQDAEAAIEAAVLPAGSSSIKKNSAWNISLNAYIGGYFGRSVNSTDMIDGNNSTVGVTAPVGIAFSKGLGLYQKGKKAGISRGALSVYATLIDVGAIAGYRLNNDSTALEQKVTLNDIFTPGGYLVYGVGFPFKWISYVPLSVGYGVQYGSRLYTNQDGKLVTSEHSRWRTNWFIAIDIPLTNFWTKSYKKKN